MKKNTFATVATAAALAFGGIALAQSPAGTSSSNDATKSSTPGAGCTATGNAMSAGNLGGNATNKNCDTKTMGAPAAAAAAAPAPAATTDSTAGTTSSSTTSSADTSTGASTAAAPAPSADTSSTGTATTRTARADRG